MQAAAAELEDQFGSLANVSNGDVSFWFRGTEYVMVVHVYTQANLHLLACQLTDRAYFSSDLVDATARTLFSMEESLKTVGQSAVELSSLGEAAAASDNAVNLVLGVISRVSKSLFESLAIVGMLLIFVVLFMIFMVIVVVRPVTILAQRMDAVAKLQLEDAKRDCESLISEIQTIWKGFGVLVQQLTIYKQFLPHVVVSPNVLDLDDQTALLSPLRTGSLALQPIEAIPSAVSGTSTSMDSPDKQHFEDSFATSCSTEDIVRAASPTTTNPLEQSCRSLNYSSRRRPHHSPTSSFRPDMRLSCEVAHQTVQYGTVLCANLSGTHRMLECFTTNMTLRSVVHFLELVMKYKKDGWPLSFFGDRVLLAFTRPSHAVNAIKAGLEMCRGSRQGSMQVNVGISSGKLVMGGMGHTGLKAFNCVGSVVGMAVALTNFCSTVKTTMLVNEEVFLKARYSYQFIPVAMMAFPGPDDSTHPVYHPTRLLTLDDANEWMYNLDKQEKDTKSLEGLLMRLFTRWRHNAFHIQPDLLREARSRIELQYLDWSLRAGDIAAGMGEGEAGTCDGSAAFCVENMVAHHISFCWCWSSWPFQIGDDHESNHEHGNEEATSSSSSNIEPYKFPVEKDKRPTPFTKHSLDDTVERLDTNLTVVPSDMTVEAFEE